MKRKTPENLTQAEGGLALARPDWVRASGRYTDVLPDFCMRVQRHGEVLVVHALNPKPFDKRSLCLPNSLQVQHVQGEKRSDFRKARGV